MRDSIRLALLLGAVVGFSACEEDAPSTAAPAAAPAAPAAEAPVAFDERPAVGTRATCPVMGNVFVVSQSTGHSEHEGKHYAFCCPGCKPQFDADPEKYTGG